MAGVGAERCPEDSEEAVASELVHESVLLHYHARHSGEVLVEHLEPPRHRPCAREPCEVAEVAEEDRARDQLPVQLTAPLDGRFRECRGHVLTKEITHESLLPEPFDHVVEAHRQLPDLVCRSDVGGDVQLSLLDPPHRGLQPAPGPPERACSAERAVQLRTLASHAATKRHIPTVTTTLPTPPSSAVVAVDTPKISSVPCAS